MTWRNRLNSLSVLYKHYSSYGMYAIAVYEAAKLQGVALSWLPRWIVLALSIASLAAKVWKQQQPPKVQP